MHFRNLDTQAPPGGAFVLERREGTAGHRAASAGIGTGCLRADTLRRSPRCLSSSVCLSLFRPELARRQREEGRTSPSCRDSADGHLVVDLRWWSAMSPSSLNRGNWICNVHVISVKHRELLRISFRRELPPQPLDSLPIGGGATGNRLRNYGNTRQPSCAKSKSFSHPGYRTRARASRWQLRLRVKTRRDRLT